MKRKRLLVKFMIVACLTSFLTTYDTMTSNAALPFDDISDSYAQTQIIDLYNKNMITGTGERKFEPSRPVTRAEFASMLQRVFGLEPVKSEIPSYTDVPMSAWYYSSVQSSDLLGFVKGTGAGQFSPDVPITRQEAAVLLIRALKKEGADSTGTSMPFSDKDLIPSWAYDDVAAAYKWGLIQGSSGKFRPVDPVSRQETAVMLDRIVRKPEWAAVLSAVQPQRIQLGWQYGTTTKQFKQRVLSSPINTISPRWYFLEQSASISDETDTSLISWAKSKGLKTWAMVGNRSDPDTTHQMLSSVASREEALGKLSGYADKYRLDGLNIDFENVLPEDRANLTLFLRQLSEALHRFGAVLSINVSPDTGTDWTDAFDYKELGQIADYIVLMGYDEYWGSGSKAGSVSSLPWLQKGMNKLAAQVKADKIILGMPLYTRDWTIDPASGTVSSQDLTLERQSAVIRANQAKVQWDAAMGQYTASYRMNGAEHRIWVEDVRSLMLKYATAAGIGAAGYAYWHIGGESPDIWSGLRNAAKYAGYRF